MERVIDTSVWIDHLRSRTSEATRRLADIALNDPDAFLCDAVRFELLAGAAKRERSRLLKRLATMPHLPTPPDLWSTATSLAVALSDRGVQVPPMDLMIAAICIHHRATLVTFDAHFGELAQISELQVNLLIRPD